VSIFDLVAPIMNRADSRWTHESVGRIAGWLRDSVPQGGELLDLGGGTGGLALGLAEHLRAHVTILDASPKMLSYVEGHPDVHSVKGDAAAMPFEHDSFDAVVISDAFHHLRDQDSVVHEICRVVRNEGGIVILEFDPTSLGIRMVRLAERLVGEPGAFHTPEGLAGFMRERGIEGLSEIVSGAAYAFKGTVA